MTIFTICLLALLLALSAWLLLAGWVLFDRLRYERLLARLVRSAGAAGLPGEPSARLPRGASRGALHRLLLDPDMPAALRDHIAQGLLAADGLPKLLRDAGAGGGGRRRWRRIAAWEVLRRTGYGGLHGILGAALAQGDPAVQLAAVGMLGALADQRAAAMLVEALREGRGAAHCIVMQLDRFESEAVVGLLTPLLDDERAVLRVHAIAVLGRHRLPGMDQRLGAFGGDANPAVRKAVAQAMGDLGGPHALIVASELLRDRQGYVRAHAVRALHNISLTRPIRLDYLLAPLQSDDDWWVRLAVRDAMLRALDGPSGKAPQLGAGVEWGQDGAGDGRAVPEVAGGGRS
ncbi:hypothetical protein AB595_14190 [Massilia sp. WF1]|uniref:HEAT repeat domain-containing protein n=1 Tax=unclassified Massilia TaxID=2609279 RepID=UPI000649F428|nr:MULTISPECIES: HEAT repeat domain-containing protein [unclassified Massilia]ALK97100.1 hypothetical protein AM586_13415 [Massilia sp. WG5]KLU36138.1 hypothetical protein AB595_14190 [Massilia sp. WF1]